MCLKIIHMHYKSIFHTCETLEKYSTSSIQNTHAMTVLAPGFFYHAYTESILNVTFGVLLRWKFYGTKIQINKYSKLLHKTTNWNDGEFSLFAKNLLLVLL